MGIEEFIGEAEASTLSGVSQSTLKRFTEAGYLKPESDADGLKLYSKTELAKLFQIEFQTNIVHFPTAESFKTPQSITPTQEIRTQEPRSEIPTMKAQSTDQQDSSSNGNTALKTEVTQPSLQANNQRIPEALLYADSEILKLKNIIKLQEDLMKFQDKRIEDLQEEKNWLRNQIAEFQEKASRDQVLLLSQTQALSKTLTVLGQRKGLITKTLERIGFLPAPEQENNK